jgi:NAD(P)-dependent dehydrogenase (short-subunit alcohol dehydrogenase family)
MPDHSDTHIHQRTLLLTGASRGIGHATGKLFYQSGWRVLTVSRAPFTEDCPWPGGGDNHIQADLSDPTGHQALADEVRNRLGGSGLCAIVNNAASLAEAGGRSSNGGRADEL